MNFINTIKTLAEWFFSLIIADKSRLHLNGRRLKIVKQVGEGGFSFVYLAKSLDQRKTTSDDIEARSISPANKSADSLMALKKIRIELPEQALQFEMEIRHHKLMKDYPDRILQLLESGVIDGFGYLLFPYYKHGTLQDLIFQTVASQKHLDKNFISQFARKISESLLLFHNQDPPLAFRDLKPANVLLDKDRNPVLMDLGSVDIARKCPRTRNEALALQEIFAETCTAPFRAPELFDVKTDSVIDERSDSWSLGCTMYAMIYGQSPFDGSSTAAFSGRVSFPETTISDIGDLKTIIASLLEVDMNRRPYIRDINWN